MGLMDDLCPWLRDEQAGNVANVASSQGPEPQKNAAPRNSTDLEPLYQAGLRAADLLDSGGLDDFGPLRLANGSVLVNPRATVEAALQLALEGIDGERIQRAALEQLKAIVEAVEAHDYAEVYGPPPKARQNNDNDD